MNVHPNALPCITTAAEMKPVMDGIMVQALTNLMNAPVDPSVPDDPALLENMKLWDDKEAFLAAELLRIKAKFRGKKK